MAIWPFGRKGKRNTVQVDSNTRKDVAMSQGPRHSFDEATLGRKPSRKHSKRRKNRYSQPVDVFPANLNNASKTSQHNQYSSSGFQNERNRPAKAHTFHPSSAPNSQSQLSPNTSLRKPERSHENRATLKKRLSKRKAYEIAREREIRMMSSMPIDIPRRFTTPSHGDPMQIDHRRNNSAQSRRLDRHRSDVSLSIQESVASSLSDYSETYTFKVNGFAAWTPRPVIRYVESPRTTYSRHQKSPEPAERRNKSPTLGLEVSDEDLRSKRRVDELANDLDAGSLRELMDRDQRRRERQQIKDQEKLVRKLQRNAQRVPKSGPPIGFSHAREDTIKEPSSHRGRSSPREQSQPTTQETEAFLSGETEGSWLRDTSRARVSDARESQESVHVIGNIDDSSIRERKAGNRFSFGLSNQDMTISRSTLSPSIAPSRQGVQSPDSSQLYGTTRGSVSDLSKNVGSERRLSDHSGHVNAITSILRRGSSRIKRSYSKRFPNRSPPPPKNVSHESFFKVHTQTPAPAPYVPPKVLLGPSSFKRSQSKFTEHFGDELLSPPDSRLQSPDIPEVEDEPLAEDQVPDLQTGSHYPISGSDGAKNQHQSWTESVEEDPENLPLSQSLASVDSEGSWMSGHFLRRISQRQPNSARHSLSSSRNRTEDGLEKPPKGENPDAQFIGFGACPDENAESGEAAADQVKSRGKDSAAPQPQALGEAWREDVAKRPVFVNPAVRPQSTAGLVTTISALSPISADEEASPVEEQSGQAFFPADDDTATNTQARR
ncbi:uncharacterized protein BDV17DRAFT_240167 [Aspergillus undulatus]|uniref:uncharacterized protein n=1 Tax=Aspergillus undulatus TaxID=1810928 RepID=UPI003CCCCE86